MERDMSIIFFISFSQNCPVILFVAFVRLLATSSALRFTEGELQSREDGIGKRSIKPPLPKII